MDNADTHRAAVQRNIGKGRKVLSMIVRHDPAALLARVTRNLASSSPVALTATPAVFAQTAPCDDSIDDIDEISNKLETMQTSK